MSDLNFQSHAGVPLPLKDLQFLRTIFFFIIGHGWTTHNPSELFWKVSAGQMTDLFQAQSSFREDQHLAIFQVPSVSLLFLLLFLLLEIPEKDLTFRINSGIFLYFTVPKKIYLWKEIKEFLICANVLGDSFGSTIAEVEITFFFFCLLSYSAYIYHGKIAGSQILYCTKRNLDNVFPCKHFHAPSGHFTLLFTLIGGEQLSPTAAVCLDQSLIYWK